MIRPGKPGPVSRTWSLLGLLALVACGDSTIAGGGGGNGGAPGSAGAGGGGAPPVAPEPLILSWNLQTFPKHQTTIDKVSAVITNLRPALLGVVEIDDTLAFESMIEALPPYQFALNDDPGAFSHVGLVFDPERASVGEVETLFSDDSYAFPRPPLKATVNLALSDGSTLSCAVIVLHLKAMLDQDSEERRRQAVLVLDDYIREQVGQGIEDDFVLLGDLNDSIDDPPPWNVFGPFLDAPDFYRFLTDEPVAAGDFTYIPFESFIDHVLVTTGTLDELGSEPAQVFHLETEVADYESTVSDHLPVGAYAR